MTEINLTESDMEFILEAVKTFNESINKNFNETNGISEKEFFRLNHEQGILILGKLTQAKYVNDVVNKD